MCRKLCLYIIFLCALPVCAIERNYYDAISVDETTPYFVSVDSLAERFAIEVRASVLTNKEVRGEGDASWSIVWNYKTPDDYNFIKITWGNTDFGDFLDRRYARLSIGEKRMGEELIFSSHSYDKGFNCGTGENSILLQYENEIISLWGGDDELMLIDTMHVTTGIGSKCGILATEPVNVATVVVETEPDKTLSLTTPWTLQSLNDYLSVSTDPVEGLWSYLDRDMEPDWARLGGRYIIALVKDETGYVILYIDGAETNRNRWSSFMIKGRLIKTIFKNHYDLVWYDAMCESIEDEAFADIKDNAILALSFPLYKAVIRFSKSELKIAQ